MRISAILRNLFQVKGINSFSEGDIAFGEGKSTIEEEWAEIKGFRKTVIEFLKDYAKRIVLRMQMKHWSAEAMKLKLLFKISVMSYHNIFIEVDIKLDGIQSEI